MFNAPGADHAPQPPKVLRTALEIVATLRQLQEGHDPLILTFKERNQRFQTYLLEVDRDTASIALDEMVPRDGEKYLQAGEPFTIEGFHEGVRVVWACEETMQVDITEGAHCYRGKLPETVTYHQRRNAFRATLQKTQLVNVQMIGGNLKAPINGKLLDISATGCKLRFDGDVTDRLRTGEVYDRFLAALPFGNVTAPVEMRYLQYEERVDTTFAGVRFYKMSGLVQRQVERFVYQLQREARRTDDV